MERISSAPFQTENLAANTVINSEFDLAVWFCGYETRSTWLRKSGFCPRARRWLNVQVDEDREAHKAEFNRTLAESEKLGGQLVPRNWDSHWREAWRTEIDRGVKEHSGPVSIFVDISSMPRSVYGPLLIEVARGAGSRVSEIVLAYVPGKHTGEVSGHQQLDGLRTLAGLEGGSRFDVEAALVLGLGYDGILADTIVDLFQMDHFSCLYADPGATADAVRRCIDVNRVLLRRAELVERAPVGNLDEWLVALQRLTSWYRGSRDVMIIPLGPKTQVVASILFCLQNPEVGFRWPRTSRTTPIDVEVEPGTVPCFLRVIPSLA